MPKHGTRRPTYRPHPDIPTPRYGPIASALLLMPSTCLPVYASDTPKVRKASQPAQPVPHQPQRHRGHIPKSARSRLARSGSRMISVFHIMHSNGKHAPQKHSLHYSAPVFVIAPRADERLCGVPVRQEASCVQTNLTNILLEPGTSRKPKCW